MYLYICMLGVRLSSDVMALCLVFALARVCIISATWRIAVSHPLLNYKTWTSFRVLQLFFRLSARKNLLWTLWGLKYRRPPPPPEPEAERTLPIVADRTLEP